MKVIIRNATPEDIPQILEIVNHAILHTTSNYLYDVQTLENQLHWFEEKKSKKFPIIVADHNGTAIGFGTYGTFREKIGYQFTTEWHTIGIVILLHKFGLQFGYVHIAWAFAFATLAA